MRRWLFLVVLLFQALPVSARQQPMALRFNPKDIFYLWAQTETDLNKDTDYREFEWRDGVTCDLSRPPDTRRCDLNIVDIAGWFAAIPALEYVSRLPPSVQWDGWDWERMQPKPGGYTPVVLMASLKGYDGEQAGQWFIACSIVPDDPDKAVCEVAYRFGHFNYVLVPADRILQIVEALKAL